jgi:hypothetical protein
VPTRPTLSAPSSASAPRTRPVTTLVPSSRTRHGTGVVSRMGPQEQKRSKTWSLIFRRSPCRAGPEELVMVAPEQSSWPPMCAPFIHTVPSAVQARIVGPAKDTPASVRSSSADSAGAGLLDEATDSEQRGGQGEVEADGHPVEGGAATPAEGRFMPSLAERVRSRRCGRGCRRR